MLNGSNQNLSAEDRERINQMLQGVKEEDLAKIQTAEDYVAFVQSLQPNMPLSENVKNTLCSEFARIKEESAGQSMVSFYGKLLLGIAGGAATAYFGGPLAAVAARAIYTASWGIFFGGVPALYNPSYLLVFMPGREHFAYAAYQAGPWIMSTIVTPAVYGAASCAENAGRWLGHHVSGLLSRKPESSAAVSQKAIDYVAPASVTPHLSLVRSKSATSLKEEPAEKEPVSTYRTRALSR